jgi:hypothetical protein
MKRRQRRCTARFLPCDMGNLADEWDQSESDKSYLSVLRDATQTQHLGLRLVAEASGQADRGRSRTPSQPHRRLRDAASSILDATACNRYRSRIAVAAASLDALKCRIGAPFVNRRQEKHVTTWSPNARTASHRSYGAGRDSARRNRLEEDKSPPQKL